LNGNNTVSAGQSKSYEAENCIELLPGFDGENGSVVDLQLVPCDNQLTDNNKKL
jgi:hypothetical protein